MKLSRESERSKISIMYHSGIFGIYCLNGQRPQVPSRFSFIVKYSPTLLDIFIECLDIYVIANSLSSLHILTINFTSQKRKHHDINKFKPKKN